MAENIPSYRGHTMSLSESCNVGNGKGCGVKMVAQRRTFPWALAHSTGIDAGGLDFRVRDGTGYCPSAVAVHTIFECDESKPIGQGPP